MRDMERNSTKILAINIFFYITSFIISTLVPNLIAAAIGVDVTESFCDKHKDLCNQDETYDENGNRITQNLVSEVKFHAYYTIFMGSVLSGILVTGVIYLTVILPKEIYNDRCKKEEKEDIKTALLPPTNSNANTCCRLFTKFKENVLPSKWDTCQLIMITANLIAAGSFVTWLTASFSQGDICASSSINSDKCPHFSNINDTHVQHELSDLSDDVYNAIMSTGIILTSISSIAFSAGTMALSTCIKYCINRKNEQAFSIIQNTDAPGL